MTGEQRRPPRTTVVRASTEEIALGCALWMAAAITAPAAVAWAFYLTRSDPNSLETLTAIALALAGFLFTGYTIAKINMRIVGNDVTVRNILRTHRFKASDVVRVKSARGWLAPGTGCAAIYIEGRRRRIKVAATLSDFSRNDAKHLTETLQKAAREHRI